MAFLNLSVSSENWALVERVLRNERRKFGLLEQDPMDQFLDNQPSDLENIYECLHVGLCAPRQGSGSGSGSEFTCSSKHGCLRDPANVLHTQNQIHSLENQ